MIAISEKELGIVIDILKKYVPQCEVRAFGSRYKWTNKDYSDLDLAVVGDRKLEGKVIDDLRQAFLESDLIFRVDVLDWWAVSDEFRGVIGEGFEVIFKNYTKSMNDWKKVKLGSVVSVRRGASPRPIQNYLQNFGIPWVKIADATKSNSRFIYTTKEFIKVEGSNNSVLVEPETLIVSNSATPGLPKIMKIKACVHDGWLIFGDYKDITRDFLYYSFIHIRKELVNQSNGSVFNNLKTDIVREFEIMLPPLPEQCAIAATLSCLDDKIELNNRMNKTLEEMAQAIFKHWFVDFEFPDENGKPYKSNGGAMVESELGLIPEGWRVGKLGEIIENFDSKRIPLSSRKRSELAKIYPYYGATSLMDYVDDFIFNGIFMLLGEDGTVIDAQGHPVLQYVWGKFWVNNHAHVLCGKNGFSTETLFVLLKNTSVKEIVTGAVQLKINQGNMNAIKIIIPSKDILNKYNLQSDRVFKIYRNNHTQNQNLITTRNALLPKLMAGDIRVPIKE